MFPLKKGGHIRLPTRKMVLISGVEVTRKGVKPDYLISDTEMSKDEDRLLSKALEWMREDIKKAG